LTVPNPPAPGTQRHPVGRATLALRGTQQAYTAVQECDPRLAMCRGLAEYIEDIVFDAPGGRRLRFKDVHEEFADPEETGKYPSARISMRGSGTYEDRSLSPGLDPKERLPLPDGRYMVVPADFVAELAAEVWATDVVERSALLMALEAAFTPNYDRFSFDLNLPFYYGVRATYSLASLTADDDGDTVLRRFRVATIALKARLPLVRLYSFPDMRPLFDLQAVGPGADVLVSLAVT